jgi:PleD family two-component response regulator
MIAPDGSTWTQTVSAGLTMLVPGEGMERALVRADEALYRAKEGGRNKVVVA